MTRNEKLDQLLNGLLLLKKREIKKEKLPTICDISWLSKTLNLETESWEELFIEEQLIHDGFVEKIDRSLRISNKGHDFITGGGYKKRAKRVEQDDKIKEETIKKFRYDRIALLIAIIALVISVINFFYKAIKI